MVHFLLVARCNCSLIDAGNVGDDPAADAAIAPRSGVPDARAARVGRGSARRMHNDGPYDSHAHGSVDHHRDGDHRGWGVGDNNGQYQRFKLD